MRYLTVFFLVLVTIGQLIPLACAQTNQAMELEGAIAKEQADGDLKTAIQSFQKLSGDASAPREIRAKALLHLLDATKSKDVSRSRSMSRLCANTPINASWRRRRELV